MTTPINDENTVYISNLHYKLDRDNLKNIFSNFGEVRQVKLLIDTETQQSKGMAFIRMGDSVSAKKAIKGLNGQIIDGRTVKVAPAIPMKAAPKPYHEAKPETKKESKERSDKPMKKGPVHINEFLATKFKKTK